MSHGTLNIADRVRESGFRLTPQRQLILDKLCDLGGHASVVEVFEQVNQVSSVIDKATVYRGLKFFEELGVVVSAEIASTTIYEIASEIPHHHLECVECGNVSSFEHSYVSGLEKALLSDLGFTPNINHLTIKGICRHCTQS